VIDYLYLPIPKRTYKAFGDHEASGLWTSSLQSHTEQREQAEREGESKAIIIDLHEE
jgi:hypothetical protein